MRSSACITIRVNQGHIPSELLDFEGGVNIALGLPIVLTSVDHRHGVRYCRQGAASTHSLIGVIEFAEKLTAL